MKQASDVFPSWMWLIQFLNCSLHIPCIKPPSACINEVCTGGSIRFSVFLYACVWLCAAVDRVSILWWRRFLATKLYWDPLWFFRTELPSFWDLLVSLLIGKGWRMQCRWWRNNDKHISEWHEDIHETRTSWGFASFQDGSCVGAIV